MNFHVAFWLMVVIAGGLFWIGGLFVARIRRLEKIVDEKMAVMLDAKEDEQGA